MAHQAWAGRVEFVGVAWAGDEASFTGFVDKYQLTFPQISDDVGAVYGRFSIPVQPALVVVGANGTSETLFGAVDEETLDRVLHEATST